MLPPTPSTPADGRDGPDGVHRVLAPQRLSSQQNAIHSIQHGVGNIRRLGAGRARGVDHGVNHAGDDHRLAHQVARLRECVWSWGSGVW